MSSDTPIHDETAEHGVDASLAGEQAATWHADTEAPTPAPVQEAPAPVGQDNTPDPDDGVNEGPALDEQAPTPAGAPLTQGVNVPEQQSTGIATRDGKITDPHPVTTEDMARVKVRRHPAETTTNTTADGITQA